MASGFEQAQTEYLRALTQRLQPQQEGLFDQIIRGLGSGAAIGAGISSITNPQETTITRNVPAAGSTELSSLARLGALQGGLLSDVGFRETPGAAGQTTLTNVGVPLTPLQQTGQQLGQQAGSLLGGQGTLNSQSRQQLISMLQSRAGGGGTGLLNLTGGGNQFTGSATGPGFTSAIGSSSGGSGSGGGGMGSILPTLGAIGGAALPILRQTGILERLGLGGAGGAPTGVTAGSGGGAGLPPGGTPPVSSQIASLIAQGVSPSTANLIANFIDPALAARGLSVPSSANLSSMAANINQGYPDAVRSILGLATQAGTTISPSTAALLPGLDAALGLTGGVATPSATSLGLTQGFPALLEAAQSGTGIFAGTGAAAGGAAAGQGGGFLSGLAGAAKASAGPLAVFAAIPTIAGLFGAFRGPNRSMVARRGIENSLKEPIGEFLMRGAGASNIGEGSIGDILNHIPGADEFGVSGYVNSLAVAAREAGAKVAASGKDAERAASIIVSSILTTEATPEKAAQFLAALGASPQAVNDAYLSAKATYNPAGIKRGLALLEFGKYGEGFNITPELFADMPQVAEAVNGLLGYLTAPGASPKPKDVAQFTAQMRQGGLSEAAANRFTQIIQQQWQAEADRERPPIAAQQSEE